MQLSKHINLNIVYIIISFCNILYLNSDRDLM